jgi:hypothetical protein
MEASYEVLASRSRNVDGKPTSMADIGYINANVDGAWQDCEYTNLHNNFNNQQRQTAEHASARCWDLK